MINGGIVFQYILIEVMIVQDYLKTTKCIVCNYKCKRTA
jgi:hypothetical protein